MIGQYGVKIIPATAYPKPGETRAPATVARILMKRGEEHTRLVLATLCETQNNAACYDETGFWSTSDMLLACQPIIEKDASKWLEFFDALPLGQLQAITARFSGTIPRRFALDGMIAERVERIFGKYAAQGDLFDDRREL